MTNADGDLMRFKPTKMVIQWDNDQQKWWFNGYYNQLKHTVPLKHIRATNRVEASHTSWDLGHLVLPSKLPYWSEFMFERSIHGKLRVKFEDFGCCSFRSWFCKPIRGGQNQTFEVLNN
jgi:hypothetical protein